MKHALVIFPGSQLRGSWGTQSLLSWTGSYRRFFLRVGWRRAYRSLFDEHLRVGEAVSHVDIGEQVYRFGWIVLDLLAQLADEGAQILDLFAALGAPYFGEQP